MYDATEVMVGNWIWVIVAAAFATRLVMFWLEERKFRREEKKRKAQTK